MFGVTWRSVLIATVLTPINCYWVVMMGEVRYSGHPTTVSLFFNVLFCILILRGINELLRRKAPPFALSQGELLLVYTMLSISSALAGHDGIQMLAPIISAPYWYATTENKWQEMFLSELPDHWIVSDMGSLDALFSGTETPYSVDNLLPWVVPILTWTVYMVVLLLVMLCINIIIRRQWTQNEKLSYPLTEIPLGITEASGRLFANKLIWIGFALAAGIDVLNGLHVLYPSVPDIRVRIFNIHPYIRAKPWSAIGWTPISFYPFAVGLGYLLPQDQLFSCWFFFLYWKAVRIGSSIVGYEPQWWTASAPPYINEQAFGGYVGLFVFSLWAMRGHLRSVWERVTETRSNGDFQPTRWLRMSVWGIVGGVAFLVWFSVAGGMSLWVAISYFAIFLMLSVVVTRIRAELGHPVHDLHFAGPELIIPKVVGTANMRTVDLTTLSVHFWQNRAYRNHQMPHQLEGIRMAEETGFDVGPLLWAMVWASVIGALGSFWGWLHPAFRMGVGAKWHGAASHFGRQPYQRLQGWLLYPKGPAWGATVAILIGFLSVMALTAARTRFARWPFHPIGYAVSGGWSMNCLWLPLLIAWILKALILRYGRARSYRRAMPFFIGLVLGEFVTGSVWTIIGIAEGISTYGFWV